MTSAAACGQQLCLLPYWDGSFVPEDLSNYLNHNLLIMTKLFSLACALAFALVANAATGGGYAHLYEG